MNTTDFKTLKNEQKTAQWLLANGISTAQFEKTDISICSIPRQADIPKVLFSACAR